MARIECRTVILDDFGTVHETFEEAIEADLENSLQQLISSMEMKRAAKDGQQAILIFLMGSDLIQELIRHRVTSLKVATGVHQ